MTFFSWMPKWDTKFLWQGQNIRNLQKNYKKHNWRIVSARTHTHPPAPASTCTSTPTHTRACTLTHTLQQTNIRGSSTEKPGYLEKSNFIWNSKNLNAENKSKTLATSTTTTMAAITTTTTTTTITTAARTTKTSTTMTTITTTAATTMTTKEQNESHKKQFKNLGQRSDNIFKRSRNRGPLRLEARTPDAVMAFLLFTRYGGSSKTIGKTTPTAKIRYFKDTWQ